MRLKKKKTVVGTLTGFQTLTQHEIQRLLKDLVTTVTSAFKGTYSSNLL